MRPTLPSAIGWFFALACARHPDVATLPVPPPLPASPELELGTMEAECDAMIAANEALMACPNREADERAADKATLERWRDVDFPALQKGKPDEPSKKAIAVACRRAATSLAAATERCRNGRKPRADHDE